MKHLFKGVIVVTVISGCTASQSTLIEGQEEGTNVQITEVSLKRNNQVEPQRERYIQENIVELAEDTFPDNIGQAWIIHGFEHLEHLTFVEVEPQPDNVGYPKIKFVVSFIDANTPKKIATYAFEDGRYNLLCTVRGIQEDLPQTLNADDTPSN